MYGDAMSNTLHVDKFRFLTQPEIDAFEREFLSILPDADTGMQLGISRPSTVVT